VTRIALHDLDMSNVASPLCRKRPPETASDTSSQCTPKYLAIEIVDTGVWALRAPGERLGDAVAPTMKPCTYQKAEENPETPTGESARDLGRTIVPCAHPQSHVSASKV